MKDLTETLATIALSIALIGVTYSLLGAWLILSVTKAFAGIADPL